MFQIKRFARILDDIHISHQACFSMWRNVPNGRADIQDDREILQGVEQDLQQRRETLQAIQPDAAMADGDQPMDPAEDSPALVVSSCTVLRLAQATHLPVGHLKQLAVLHNIDGFCACCS